ncbi:MAG TPA: TIGR03619 family F420-dependent LLM class oxidoreductase [Pseudomonadales bacterium]|nr:TIGR03619 family F420-dependent LLM class oxidoreductase [Pseudomonadales bacterium]
MKYWISLVNTEEVDQFIAIAQKAEELGYEGVTVPDHLVYPTRIETPYPYTPDGKVWWPHTNPWTDPWVTLTAMGVATKTLRLATNIFLAALRDPFTVARATAAAAIFTNNRVTCGVSAGWLKEEFALLNVDFASRGRRLDEIITCMHQLHTGQPVSHQGEFFEYHEVVQSPAPTQKVPVWVGGASQAAFKRAAANDGWLGVPSKNKRLAEIVGILMDLRKANGRYGQPFDVVLSPMELLTREFVDSLDPAATYHSSVLPWTPSPWGRAFWVEEGEDHRELAVKFRAMERFKAMMQKAGAW